MKSNLLHSAADQYLMGYSISPIHSFMDSFVKSLGPQHRQVNHIIPIVELFGIIYGKKGENIALLHLFLDMKIIDSDYIESLPDFKEQVKMMKRRKK